MTRKIERRKKLIEADFLAPPNLAKYAKRTERVLCGEYRFHSYVQIRVSRLCQFCAALTLERTSDRDFDHRIASQHSQHNIHFVTFRRCLFNVVRLRCAISVVPLMIGVWKRAIAVFGFYGLKFRIFLCFFAMQTLERLTFWQATTAFCPAATAAASNFQMIYLLSFRDRIFMFIAIYNWIPTWRSRNFQIKNPSSVADIYCGLCLRSNQIICLHPTNSESSQCWISCLFHRILLLTSAFICNFFDRMHHTERIHIFESGGIVLRSNDRFSFTINL